MKKSLVAMACLSAMAGVAGAAQIDLYGTINTYVAVNHAGGEQNVSLASGGASASFWGIQGAEELNSEHRRIESQQGASSNESA